MRWRPTCFRQHFRASRAIEIGAPVERVYRHWTRYEDFPHLMASVRRAKRIDERCVLWDVDIAGHQLVWEARIVEDVPRERIRWESRRGPDHRGEVRFEALSTERTRLAVTIEYTTRSWLEWLGARLALVEIELARDLARFRRHLERSSVEDGPPALRRSRPRTPARATG